MEDRPSKLWRLALVATLALLVIVAYIRIEPFRQIVDDKCPWIKQQLAERGIRLEGSSIIQTVPAALSSSAQETAPQNAALAPAREASSAPVAPSFPATSSSGGGAARTGDINHLVADHSLWPKTVKIKQATSFPAVVDGKKVGEISLPAGTEVKLVQVQPDKIGVAYSPDGKVANLGGVWLKTTDTDLLERVRAGR